MKKAGQVAVVLTCPVLSPSSLNSQIFEAFKKQIFLLLFFKIIYTFTLTSFSIEPA